MTKENAEKFMALYQQHKAIAKELAEINTKSEDELLAGLAKLSREVGIPATKEEIGDIARRECKEGGDMEEVAGGADTAIKYAGFVCVCTN